jgi:Domain of Unknown Function (DUF1259)
VKLATSVRAALAESKTPFEPPAASSGQADKLDLDIDKLNQVLGAKGKVNGGVYQFSIPRREAITENGMPVAPAMASPRKMSAFRVKADSFSSSTKCPLLTQSGHEANRHPVRQVLFDDVER